MLNILKYNLEELERLFLKYSYILDLINKSEEPVKYSNLWKILRVICGIKVMIKTYNTNFIKTCGAKSKTISLTNKILIAREYYYLFGRTFEYSELVYELSKSTPDFNKIQELLPFLLFSRIEVPFDDVTFVHIGNNCSYAQLLIDICIRNGHYTVLPCILRYIDPKNYNPTSIINDCAIPKRCHFLCFCELIEDGRLSYNVITDLLISRNSQYYDSIAFYFLKNNNIKDMVKLIGLSKSFNIFPYKYWGWYTKSTRTWIIEHAWRFKTETPYMDSHKFYGKDAQLSKNSYIMGLCVKQDELYEIINLANVTLYSHDLYLSSSMKALQYRKGIYYEFCDTLKKRKFPEIQYKSRKTLLSDVLFLTRYISCRTVLYIGDVSKDNLLFLKMLFPLTTFHVFCSNVFEIDSKYGVSNINISNINTFDEANWANHDLLIIFNVTCVVEKNKNIEALDWQRNIINTIKPIGSCISFKLPFDKISSFEYIKGDIVLPVWAPMESTETKLIINKSDINTLHKYNPLIYNSQIYYINSILRIWGSFDVDIQDMDKNYDSFMETKIWQMYIDINKIYTIPELVSLANNICPIKHYNLTKLRSFFYCIIDEFKKYVNDKKEYFDDYSIEPVALNTESLDAFDIYIKKSLQSPVLCLKNFDMRNPDMLEVLLKNINFSTKCSTIDVRNCGLGEKLLDLVPSFFSKKLSVIS